MTNARQVHPMFQPLLEAAPPTGSLERDVGRLLHAAGKPHTAEHSLRVARAAQRLAERFDSDPDAAYAAGLLHDVSNVFPNDVRIAAAEQLGLDILPEERQFPMIIHQKLSRAMAAGLFAVSDPAVLSAVECHTTLKAGAATSDLALFVADKIEWDQAGNPPYIESLLAQLDVSLAHAAFAYIGFLWERRSTLKVLHPWLADAYRELSARFDAQAGV